MNAKIPISLKLRRKAEKEVVYAQDLIIEELYNFMPEAVLHGGTAIWRCYQGNRFSEDVDVYIAKDNKKINDFFYSLERKGFKIIKKRIKENSLYSELAFQNTRVRFEATFQTKKPIFKAYETSESTFINVYILSPEELIIEKINAYLKRLKIRDLYDIHFLLEYVENKSKIKPELNKLIAQYKSPKDEKELANIIISGAVPTSEYLLNNIKIKIK